MNDAPCRHRREAETRSTCRVGEAVRGVRFHQDGCLQPWQVRIEGAAAVLQVYEVRGYLDSDAERLIQSAYPLSGIPVFQKSSR